MDFRSVFILSITKDFRELKDFEEINNICYTSFLSCVFYIVFKLDTMIVSKLNYT